MGRDRRVSRGRARSEFLTDADRHGDGVDSEMDGFVALCAVLGKLERVSLAKCGLGPASAAELAKAVSSADAVVRECPRDHRCTLTM